LSAAVIDDSSSSAMNSSGCANVMSGRRSAINTRPLTMTAPT